MLSSLNLENKVYVRSTEMCPDHIIRQAHERAILKAYTDWYALAQSDGNILGIEPVKESIARMAEVEYQVKMAAL